MLIPQELQLSHFCTLHPKDKDVLKKEKANKLVINLLAF